MQGGVIPDGHNGSEAKRFSLPGQEKIEAAYSHKYTQFFVAAVIFINFIISACEAQMLPEEGTELKDVFSAFEWLFNIIFGIELLVNIYANWLYPFINNGWNIFDVLIVTISWISMLADFPGITVLRLFRAFRVFRLFKRIQALRVIIAGAMKALPGVFNAFVILGLVMGIWSIMGVHFFGEDFPDEFGNFAKGMLTCIQMMTYDSWVSGITRPICLFYGNEIAPIFFISYAFMSAIIMANVVIAILVDKYTEAVQEMAEQDSAESGAKYAGTASSTLDPVAKVSLCTATSNICSNLSEIKEISEHLLTGGESQKGGQQDGIKELLPGQRKVKAIFDSPKLQLSMAILIFVNFVFAAAEAQIKPLDPSPEYEVFMYVDYAFNGIFTIELILNMYSNFFFPFWTNLWNIFDFAIVFVSLFSIFFVPVNVTALRLFRALRRSIVAFKVVRLLKMDNLKMIVIGVLRSLPGVTNAFLLLGLIMGIWSIMGVNFYKNEFPDEFGNFFKAMLSMCQIATFDSWSSGITRPVLLHENTEPHMGAMFFVTFVFASAIIMMNVVLAILIDKFLSTAKDIEEQNKAAAEEKAKADRGGEEEPFGETNNPLWEFGDRVNKELVDLRKLMGGPLTELVEMQKAMLATTARAKSP